MTAITIRDYQAECIQAIREEWASGAHNVLISLATGLGKTIIFSALGGEIRREGAARRILVLAHRKELVRQTHQKWQEVNPVENVGIYMGPRRDIEADVICASVASCYPDLYRTDPCERCGKMKSSEQGLERVRGAGCEACGGEGETHTLVRRGRIWDLPLDEIDIVIVDEAHHVTRESGYVKVIDAIRHRNPDMRVLMVTATPFRRDGRGFGWLVDGVAYAMGIRTGIERGWLAPFSRESCRIELDVDWSQLRISDTTGDFVDDDIGAALDTDDARREIVNAWKRASGPGAPNAPSGGRPTVVFCPTIDFADHLCTSFRDGGIAASWIASDPAKIRKDERKRRLRAYARRDVRVICNVGILTEGWDDPGTSCVMITRPTKSHGLYAQMLGRGTRMAPDKADCLVIDCAGASELGIKSLADLSRDPTKEEILAAQEDEEDAPEQDEIPFPDEAQTVRVHGHTTYEIELFSGRISWIKLNGARVAVMSPNNAVVVFASGKLGDETLYTAITKDKRKGLAWLAQDQGELAALRAGELHAIEHANAVWLNPNKHYDKQPPSRVLKQALARLIGDNIKTGRPPAIAREQVDGLSMSLANAWRAMLEVRLAYIRHRGAP